MAPEKCIALISVPRIRVNHEVNGFTLHTHPYVYTHPAGAKFLFHLHLPRLYGLSKIDIKKEIRDGGMPGVPKRTTVPVVL